LRRGDVATIVEHHPASDEALAEFKQGKTKALQFYTTNDFSNNIKVLEMF
ncbi:MAG: hypothetical protein GDA48_06180, partial [Hormoscilla sp. GM102CHS1]|nr:hypothetical protein [Hormoscilla sp. GM102CHS1]